jgi:hypothetical protein
MWDDDTSNGKIVHDTFNGTLQLQPQQHHATASWHGTYHAYYGIYHSYYGTCHALTATSDLAAGTSDVGLGLLVLVGEASAVYYLLRYSTHEDRVVAEKLSSRTWWNAYYKVRHRPEIQPDLCTVCRGGVTGCCPSQDSRIALGQPKHHAS